MGKTGLGTWKDRGLKRVPALWEEEREGWDDRGGAGKGRSWEGELVLCEACLRWVLHLSTQ